MRVERGLLIHECQWSHLHLLVKKHHIFYLPICVSLHVQAISSLQVTVRRIHWLLGLFGWVITGFLFAVLYRACDC